MTNCSFRLFVPGIKTKDGVSTGNLQKPLLKSNPDLFKWGSMERLGIINILPVADTF